VRLAASGWKNSSASAGLPASEEYKARHLERGERVTALHIARYHAEMAGKK
jgi:hypothetical protein